jgi:DNA polymerase elongation subunit (family B)
VLEVDFTSLYPNIMVRFNISPETLMCDCCPDPSRRVPVLGYRTCDRHLGLIPRVLKPVVERRTRLKRMVREGVGDTKGYKERVDILKWLLVTCLDGSTEVPFKRNERFDVRPISEVVERECAGGCGGFSPRSSIRLYGLDEDLQPELKTVGNVFKFPAPEKMLRLGTGNGDMLVTPDHPCIVIRGRRMLVRRADRIVEGDLLPVLPPLYGPSASSVAVESVTNAHPTGDHVYCFSVDEPLHGFALANGIVTHNCFGYTGYRNARFGRIECHEAINAYGRELMLQASEIAEAHGFEILHGIVDSLWLKGNGDPHRFCEHVSGHIGIPLEPEGIYKWIVFLPDRAHGVGVLNRYYGMFEDGRLKLRGIELRRRDSCGLVKDLQEDMLARFKKAEDAKELMELVPEALAVLDRYVDEAMSGTVPTDRLLVTRRVSKTLKEYRQVNDAVAALHQLDSEGIGVNPGEQVRFVITGAGSRDLESRVRAEPFASDGEYDPEAYADLLLRGAETLLMPMGCDREVLHARCSGKWTENGKF